MARNKQLIPPQDAMFLWGETADTMMHVASLTILTPPDDAGPTYLRDLQEDIRNAPVESPWNLKLAHPKVLGHPLQTWVKDDDFDIDYHVRRSALASPGDERELGVLVSRLHSHQIDFSRPPWEMHVIEGLEGGRFATYIKVHHSLVDGYTGTRIFTKSMATDPTDRTHPFFFSLKKIPREPAPEQAKSFAEQLVGTVTAPARGAAKVVGGVAKASASSAKAIATLEFGGRNNEDLTNPRSAPDTILQQPTGRNRRFATQQYSMDRLINLAHASGGTLNDVVMAICGAGLRQFMLEQDALPDKPLIAFMPVNLREEGSEGGGNQVGALLASMGTNVADPKKQLAAVIRSTSIAKSQMKGMNQLSAMAYSGYLLAPGASQVLASMVGLKQNPLPTTFNVCLSNVPGPREPRYLRGSRAEGYYPVSIPVHGMALNITLQSYAGTLNIGFIGCRDAVPSLQRLAVYTGEALDALELAYADQLAPAAPPVPVPAPTEQSTATEQAPAKKAATKKAPAKKAPAKKSAAKKSAAKKAPAKKAAPQKAAAKKSASKNTAKKSS